jgi:hypothetical protein
MKNFIKKLFHRKRPCIIYFIDDDTCMPIATDNLQKAIEIANEIDGDLRRISDFIEWH